MNTPNVSSEFELTHADIDQLVKVEDTTPIKQEPSQQHPPQQDRSTIKRRRRGKPPVVRLPVYSQGSELSVEERLTRFNAETDIELRSLKQLCTEMDEKLQSERDRIRTKSEGKNRDDSPERRKQDQLIGTVKHRVSNLQRSLVRLQADLKTRNSLLFREYEIEKCRILVERDQRDKTSITWAHIEGLITTPQQKRLAENGKDAELHAKTICKIEP